MKSLRFILILLIAAVLFGYDYAEAGLTNLVKKIQPAVVKIVTYDMHQAVTGIGSGFFINDLGHLITNYHVLQGAFSADIMNFEGNKFPIRHILAEDRYSDLLKVSADIPDMLIQKLQVAETLPNIAEEVLVIGSPLGLEQSVSEGIVSAIRELPNLGKFFQTTAPISPGSSGSPVVNLNGDVVGVISFQSIMGQNLNFAISSEKVLAMEDRQRPKSIAEWTYALSKEKPRLAEELCRKGFQFSINGEFKKALSYYQDATREDPSDTAAWYGLSQCYVGLDQPEHVVGTYKAAIRININDATLHYNLGNYYVKLEKFKEAADAYRQAVNINPDAAIAHNKLGMAYDKLGLFEEAIASHREVLRINPRSAKSHYNIGIAFRKMGDIDKAVDAFQEAVIISPEFIDAHQNIGRLSLKQGKTEAGGEAFKQVIRIDPDNAEAHYQMGLIYLKYDDKDDAIQEYKMLKRLDQEKANRLFGRIYE